MNILIKIKYEDTDNLTNNKYRNICYFLIFSNAFEIV
jgi:hypothetical protein